MKIAVKRIPVEIIELGIETYAHIDIEEILLTSYPPIIKTVLKFYTDYTAFEFRKEYSVKIKNDDVVIKCYVGNSSNLLIQKDAGERSTVEWYAVICDSEVHVENNPLNCYINPLLHYPETKLDKIIKRNDEVQELETKYRIDFNGLIERHTRRELAHIAHEIINYLEKPDEQKTD